MFKEFTLQNIWESDMPVENGRRFKFKSAVWGPTLVEGLRVSKLFLTQDLNDIKLHHKEGSDSEKSQIIIELQPEL